MPDERPDVPRLPDSPSDWPPHVRRYLEHVALRRLLELHGDWYSVVEYLYRGRRLERGRRDWRANVKDIWPRLAAEADAFDPEQDELLDGTLPTFDPESP